MSDEGRKEAQLTLAVDNNVNKGKKEAQLTLAVDDDV